MKQPYICNFILIAVLGSSLFVATTHEAPASANPITTLDALVADALERNPELKFYEAEVIAAKAGRKSAGLLANPEVSGNIGQKTVSDSGLGAEGLAWSVSVMQPFEW